MKASYLKVPKLFIVDFSACKWKYSDLDKKLHWFLDYVKTVSPFQ